MIEGNFQLMSYHMFVLPEIKEDINADDCNFCRFRLEFITGFILYLSTRSVFGFIEIRPER
jgi:hypothetical protein